MNKDYQTKIETGLKLFQEAKYLEALEKFENLKTINKGDFLVYWYLGHTQFRLSNYKIAIKNIKNSIRLKAKDEINMAFLSELYVSINQHDLAISTLEEILEINSKNINALINLGRIYTEKGNFKKSIEYYLLVLKSEPKHYGVHYEIIKLEQSYLTIDLIIQIKEDLSQDKINAENRVFINLILATNEKIKNNYKDEIKYLVEAHSKYLEKNKTKSNQEWNYFTNLLPQFISHSNKVQLKINDKISPIFIMGLPRSGTTMIENIIASGKLKFPTGGEVGACNKVFFSKNIIKDYNSNELITDFNYQDEDFKNLKENILYQYNQLKLIDSSKNYIFTDKSIENFLYIDLLKKIFPKSKFVFCQRDPLANILGIIKNFLPNLYWTHSIEKIFQWIDIYYQNLQENLKNDQLNCTVVKLEDFSNHPKKCSKILFKFLDLEWSEDCINIDANKNIIKTASNIQLREPIKKHNLKYLENYSNIIEKYGENYDWFKN